MYLVSIVGLNSLDEHCLTIVLIWKRRFIESIAMKVVDKFCVVDSAFFVCGTDDTEITTMPVFFSTAEV